MDEYHLICDCGSNVAVHIGQCGLAVTCPDCQNSVKVPDLITLKKLSGDRYPHLTAIDKVERTAQAGETPFDGACHRCKSAAATVLFPVALNILEERDLEGDGGVSITPFGHVRKKLAAGTEYWRTLNFPLLLCESCSASYGNARQSRKWARLFKIFTLMSGLVLLTWWITKDTAVVSVVGIAALIAFLTIVSRRQQESRQAAPIDLAWLSSIRWVDEILRSQDEYQVHVGQARGLS